MSKPKTYKEHGRTPAPQILTRHRVGALLDMLDLGLAEAERRIRHTLDHEHTAAAMTEARHLDEDRAVASDAALILRARYLDPAGTPDPELTATTLFDWSDK